MGAENIWFDGVSKELLEAHSEKKTLVKGDAKTLTTKTPLEPFSHFKKKNRKKPSGHQPEANGSSGQRKNECKKNGHDKRPPKTKINPTTGLTDELAIDCEMVECYHHKSVLARVSIVNLFGHPLLDRYVAPPSTVTNYRTKYSGIRRKDLVDAPNFDTVQKEVAGMIKNRIVVGHAVHNDFGVLKLHHPPDKVRDTQVYFKNLFQGKTPSLKKLSESVLGVQIQKGEHDSVQDARATMKLYVKERDRWNEKLLKDTRQKTVKKSAPQKKKKRKPRKKRVKTIYVTTT